tara:strand:- start:33403 stop:35226 length:1824 start_codon:yes stop_codon:yes gene_type:complete
MEANNTDFTLQKNSYASFDALTLKQLIVDRLNDGEIYTDQVVEGSNVSAIIDIIAYSYHTLLFYLNQTSSETLFTQASLYENMNRIVKLINYKPVGYKTSSLTFKAIGSETLLPNLYTIKRFSYFIVDGVYYSFIDDASFTKKTTGSEDLDTLYDTNILYQGRYYEYPNQSAIGEEYEVITLSIKDTITKTPTLIEDSSIKVYVKNVNTQVYTEFIETNSLFTSTPSEPVFEKRINENGFYEFKFGSGVYGKKLNEGDTVNLFYLKSDAKKGEISANKLNGVILNTYTTPLFERISEDVYKDANLSFISPTDTTKIEFSNEFKSTPFKDKETVDEIKVNSPKSFSSNNRLVTGKDYQSFIEANYSNIVKSTNVVSNTEFINGYMNYFFSLGLNAPNDDPRFLLNQLKFSSAAELNNVYFFMVPQIEEYNQDNIESNYLTLSQKNNIVDSMLGIKMLTTELVPQDPIFTAFNLGIEIDPNEVLSPDVIDETFLVIERSTSIRSSDESIKQQINNIFIDYFKSLQLGSIVGLSDLKAQIYAVNGVNDIKTRRVVDGNIYENSNISLIAFNPVYSNIDIKIISNDTKMAYFQYPFLWNNNIKNRIIIENA